jgi:hypothetical protein
LTMGIRWHLAWLLKGGNASKRTQPDGRANSPCDMITSLTDPFPFPG